MLNIENIQSFIDRGESCNVEFKIRVSSKVRELTEEVCAFANTDGGYLLIGVNDNGHVIGANLEDDERSAVQDYISEISPVPHYELYSVSMKDKTIWVIDVPAGKDKPYIFSGSIYVREGANSQKLYTVEEMDSFFQGCNKIFFDHIPCHWFNVHTDADKQMVNDFQVEAKLSPSISDTQIFKNLELFTENGTAKNGAAMFFGRQPERKFPHAVIRCVFFKGITKDLIIEDKTFRGPLYQQYLQAITWLESELQTDKIEEAEPEEKIREIPLIVFKEAIINSLSHRDYYEQGASITIEIFDDRVEISNPGGLLPVIAKDLGRKSIPRNPLIFGLFARMHLAERAASGISRMRKAMKEANLPKPEFYTEGMFTVVFKRQNTNSDNQDAVNNPINKNEQTILNLLMTVPGLNAFEIKKRIGKSFRMTLRYIKNLQGKALIEFRGTPKNGGYFLKSNINPK